MGHNTVYVCSVCLVCDSSPLALSEFPSLSGYFRLCLTFGWNNLNERGTTAGKSVSWSVLSLSTRVSFSVFL